MVGYSTILEESPFLKKLSELNGGRVADDDPIDPAQWDSVDVLDLISVIDEEFGVTVALDLIPACRTVGDLRELIRREVAS
jgi:acyl carrier protein